MSVATLRFAPWQAKNLVPAQYASLTAAVSKVLYHTVAAPVNQLDIAWAQAFVRAYVEDDASHTLQALDGEEALNTLLSPHELSIRGLTLGLAGRLAQLRGGLDSSILVDLAVVYGTDNIQSLKTIFEDACQTTPLILETLKNEVVPAFTKSLQEVHKRSLSSTRKVAYVLAHLLTCGPVIVSPFVESKDFILTLAKCYQVGLDDFANTQGGVQFGSYTGTGTTTATGWQRDWLYTKAYLIDSFHALVRTLLQSDSSQDRDRLFDLLFVILELPSSSSASDQSSPSHFMSQSFLSDYQYTYDLAASLSKKFRGTDDARVDFLTATLARLSSSTPGAKHAGALSFLFKNNLRTGENQPKIDTKGKAKALVADIDVERETFLNLAVSQVLDIFTSYTPQYIQRCLEHPIFNGDAEKLISALLEESLPPELQGDALDVPDVAVKDHDFKFTKDRRNAWDDVPMDFSRLRIGKSREDADELLQDRSFLELMKADIIRRAEELSDEEVDAIGTTERTFAFEEDLDEVLVSLTDKDVKVAGDGDETDGEGDVDHQAQLETAVSPETILELAYIDDPKLFERDATTRRSKGRADLKLKTGWGDEQIEGWRIMLERNPRKDRILQKHEFSGNLSRGTDRTLREAESDGSSGQQGRTHGDAERGRGHGGRGRGRGGRSGSNAGRGGGNTDRDRAWKDRNKAKSANHNRKRGHDKKLARGGGGGAPAT